MTIDKVLAAQQQTALGARLRACRRARGWVQSNLPPLTAGLVSSLENGYERFTEHRVQTICFHLGLTQEEFLNGDLQELTSRLTKIYNGENSNGAS